jgi:hypothetical protein
LGGICNARQFKEGKTSWGAKLGISSESYMSFIKGQDNMYFNKIYNLLC